MLHLYLYVSRARNILFWCNYQSHKNGLYEVLCESWQKPIAIWSAVGTTLEQWSQRRCRSKVKCSASSSYFLVRYAFQSAAILPYSLCRNASIALNATVSDFQIFKSLSLKLYDAQFRIIGAYRNALCSGLWTEFHREAQIGGSKITSMARHPRKSDISNSNSLDKTSLYEIQNWPHSLSLTHVTTASRRPTCVFRKRLEMGHENNTSLLTNIAGCCMKT